MAVLLLVAVKHGYARGMGIGVIASPNLHPEGKFFCAAFSVGFRLWHTTPGRLLRGYLAVAAENKGF